MNTQAHLYLDELKFGREKYITACGQNVLKVGGFISRIFRCISLENRCSDCDTVYWGKCKKEELSELAE